MKPLVDGLEFSSCQEPGMMKMLQMKTEENESN